MDTGPWIFGKKVTLPAGVITRIDEADRAGGQARQRRGDAMRDHEETGQVTGTADKDYNLIWFVEKCLSNALRLETYIADAERSGDKELADFFRRAQAESRKGAEQGKDHLRRRLAV
ncbi:hypothetical protein [Longispora albida]|uniref:hypothetical protein n=1 Tax=Longispora albida TaxID=203523 RepID=UPI001FE023A0|nr:hypothetical protein [Longispora albida]